MPDDDRALGQNEVDVRNEARREYQHADLDPRRNLANDWPLYDVQQTALCTNDERCQADADQHDPGCPIEHQLQEELGF